MRHNIFALSSIILLFALVAPVSDTSAQDAGTVGNYNEILCMDKTETSKEMVLESLFPANLGATPEYAFLLMTADDNGNMYVVDTIKNDNENLTFLYSPSDYPDIKLPATFHIRRIATIDSQNWYESNGEAVFVVARNEYTSEQQSHCINDLPITGTYTYHDGRIETYVFRPDTLERVFYDVTELGCPHEHTIRCVPLDVPQAEVDSLGNVCQTDNKMQITYHIIKGAPTNCRITFDEAAHEAGFTDTDVELGDDNTITIDMPSIIRMEYGISLSFYDINSTNGCESDVYSQHFYPNLGGFLQEKWDDVLLVDNNDKNCNPDCDSDLKFASYQWYKNGKALEGETGQVYYEEGGLNGRYYVVMTDTAGNKYRSCEVVRRPIIDNNTAIAPLRISPVPAESQENIIVNTAGKGKITVTDMAGRTILAVDTDGSQFQMSAPKQTGVYIVSFVGTDRTRQAQRLIVR